MIRYDVFMVDIAIIMTNNEFFLFTGKFSSYTSNQNNLRKFECP